MRIGRKRDLVLQGLRELHQHRHQLLHVLAGSHRGKLIILVLDPLLGLTRRNMKK